MLCVSLQDQEGNVQFLQIGLEAQSTARIEAKVNELLGLWGQGSAEIGKPQRYAPIQTLYIEP